MNEIYEKKNDKVHQLCVRDISVFLQDTTISCYVAHLTFFAYAIRSYNCRSLDHRFQKNNDDASAVQPRPLEAFASRDQAQFTYGTLTVTRSR